MKYAMAAVAVLSASLSYGTTNTWNNSSADNVWSNAANWTGGIPAVNAYGITGRDNQIVIDGSLGQPTGAPANFDAYTTPGFKLLGGAELSLAGLRGNGGTGMGNGVIADVSGAGSHLALTPRDVTWMQLNREWDGVEVWNVSNGGLITLEVTGRLDFGFGETRRSEMNLDNGTIRLEASNMFGSRNANTTANEINLDNGSLMDLNGYFSGNLWTGDNYTGSARLTFNFDDTNSVVRFKAGGVFGNVFSVGLAYGTTFTTSLGVDAISLAVTDLGDGYFEVKADLSGGGVEYTTTPVWTGAADGDWDNTSNWVDAKLPVIDATGSIYPATLTIQGGANQPAINVPEYAAQGGSSRTPHFILETGASLAMNVSASAYGVATGTGEKATVASGATLDLTGKTIASLARDPGNITQSFAVNGTMNITASSTLALGYDHNRSSEFVVDGGVLNLNCSQLRSSYADATNTVYSKFSSVILKNDGVCSISGFFANVKYMSDSNGTATASFDLQDEGSIVTFKTGGAINDIAEAEAWEDNMWLSSTFGASALTYTDNGDGTITVGVVAGDLFGPWIEKFPTLGALTNQLDDFEPDGMDNLTEYALGGNPTNSDAASVLPTFEVAGDVMTYVYNRQNPKDANLTYTVLDGTDLVFDMNNTNVAVGVSEAVDGFESVTNQVSTAAEAKQFMKLNLQLIK